MSMNISINPWYFCNFDCDFCYLTKTQLRDKRLLPLDRLSEMLSEIVQIDEVEMVDIYGGEVGLLSKDYWNDLIDLLHLYNIHDINLITNLSMINDITTDDRVYTSVSFDFDARESHELVLKNMALLNKQFSILMLVSPKLIQNNVDEMISVLNTFQNLESVELKPYSTNQANQFDITFSDFEGFVKLWIENPNKNFKLTNETLIKSSLSKERNSFSDNHIYITPRGKYGVLEFDLNDNEFFLEYNTLEEYFDWCELEKSRVSKNKFCSSCKYYGNCLSEHLREVKSLDNSCNGFKLLLDWYHERLEN